MIVPVAVSVISIDPTGTVAVTKFVSETVKASLASTRESSVSGTVKLCVSPAVPANDNVWVAPPKSADVAVPFVKATSTSNPPSTSAPSVAVKTSIPSSLTVTSSIVIADESLSVIVPVAVSVMSIEPTGTVAVTRFVSETVKSSAASTNESSVSGTVNVCVSPAVPVKESVWLVPSKSADVAVAPVNATSTSSPPSTAESNVAVNVSVPSSLTVTSSIVTSAESLSVIVPVAVSVMLIDPTGTLAATTLLRETVKFSAASTSESSVSGTVNVCVSPAVPANDSVCAALS